MDEIWKDIQGFEGIYQVSNLGEVRSLDRYVNHNYGGKRLSKGRVLAQWKSNAGYLMVSFMVDGVKTSHLVHRLVVESFMGDIPDDLQVNHIDENKENNHLNNLNTMTPKENMNHGTGLERSAQARSKPVKATHVKTGQVLEFPSISEAGRNGFDRRLIYGNLVGRTKTHRDYKWELI